MFSFLISLQIQIQKKHADVKIWVKSMECDEQPKLQASVMKANPQAELY